MRHTWVDATRGIAISMVLVVHVLISLWDANLVRHDRALETVIVAIRVISMPTFFVISGMFVQHSLAEGHRKFLRKFLSAIVWPYLIWGSLILVAEQLGRNVRSPVDTSPTDITLIWTPIAWLWFLYVLAIFQIIYLLLRQTLGLMIALAAAGLSFNSFCNLPILASLCCDFFFFYVVGIIFSRQLLERRVPRSLGIAASLLAIPATFVIVPALSDVWTSRSVPASIAGVVALFWLGQQFGAAKSLRFLGRHSMAIYITHIFFIAGTRIILVKVFGLVDVPILFAACLAAAFIGSLFFYSVAAGFGLTIACGLGYPGYSNSRPSNSRGFRRLSLYLAT